jgi:hypothetical protein
VRVGRRLYGLLASLLFLVLLQLSLLFGLPLHQLAGLLFVLLFQLLRLLATGFLGPLLCRLLFLTGRLRVFLLLLLLHALTLRCLLILQGLLLLQMLTLQHRGGVVR